MDLFHTVAMLGPERRNFLCFPTRARFRIYHLDARVQNISSLINMAVVQNDGGNHVKLGICFFSGFPSRHPLYHYPSAPANISRLGPRIAEISQEPGKCCVLFVSYI